ncbi:MAG TPA: methyltransferase domain-containing protein [Candidatus Thermoplasmatota archaeon]|nr:methyltransferase domain-containing protein [Candidatus Thermoplasmatota archaeon]
MVPITTTEEKIQRYYDNLWSVGKKFNQKFIDGGFHFGYYEKGVLNYRTAIQNMNIYIGRLLGLGTGQTCHVLEAGCGIGATSRYLAKKYPSCHFTGISLGTEEIELAKKIQKEQHLTNIEFISGNYNNTEFKDHSFDRVFALESIVYAVNKKDVINEVSRILKPNGKCVIIDGFFPKNQPSSTFLKNAYMLTLSKRSIPGVISLQEIQSYLKSAGFTDIIIHDLSKNISKHYFFGGFFGSLKGLLSAEVKRLSNKVKGKTNEDTDNIIGGAGFLEMLLGITKNLGYYAIVATKK